MSRSLFRLGQTSKAAGRAAIKNVTSLGPTNVSIQVLAGAVAAASRTGPDGDGLQNWLANGDYDGTETVESLAAEWDQEGQMSKFTVAAAESAQESIKKARETMAMIGVELSGFEKQSLFVTPEDAAALKSLSASLEAALDQLLDVQCPSPGRTAPPAGPGASAP